MLDKQRVKNVKEYLGLTAAAKFCAFVIHIPDNGEFIAKIYETPYCNVISYAPIPDYTLKYRHYEKAVKLSKKCDKYKTAIGFLFDLGTQYFVGFESYAK